MVLRHSRGREDLDQPGRIVAVKKGTTGHNYAAGNIKKGQLLVLDKESAAVLEVVQGKADAFIYDSLSVFRSQRRHPDTTRAILRPFREETWAIGLRLGDDALRRQRGALRAGAAVAAVMPRIESSVRTMGARGKSIFRRRYPITPKRTMTSTSKVLLLTL